MCIAAPTAHDAARLRGPLHEAFAAPLAGVDRPGTIVNSRLRPPQEELPAAIKPVSPRAIWIPGYWGWEPAEEEFLWVPGVWRVPPPGMRWVPGYWAELEGGVRWVRGFWSPVKEPRLRYLPPPPDKRRVESPDPPTPADRFRVPGHWQYTQGEYQWKEGFSSRHKNGWVWTPAHAAWTPRGALLIPGYWDYALPARGFAFAPLRVGIEHPQGPARRQTTFAPEIAMNLARLPEALFVDAGQGHYLFGDYFDRGWSPTVAPWYKSDERWGVDLNFAYEAWRRRGAPDWPRELAQRYERRRDDATLRPPLAYSPSTRHDAQSSGDLEGLGVPSSALARSRSPATAIQELRTDAVRRAAAHAASLTTLAAQRAKFEQGPTATPDAKVTFFLPAPAEPLEHTQPNLQPRSATAGQYVPGVSGRAVPGATGRGLPGMSGRTVPGVDVRVPGATAPDVLPGADTGLERP